jgi:hypothetical protein
LSTSAQKIIELDDHGHYWLRLDLLEQHNEYVVFHQPDGSAALDFIRDGDVFEWDKRQWEVLGFDRPNKRAWVIEYVPPKIDKEPAGRANDPRDDPDLIDRRPRWSR